MFPSAFLLLTWLEFLLTVALITVRRQSISDALMFWKSFSLTKWKNLEWCYSLLIIILSNRPGQLHVTRMLYFFIMSPILVLLVFHFCNYFALCSDLLTLGSKYLFGYLVFLMHYFIVCFVEIIIYFTCNWLPILFVTLPRCPTWFSFYRLVQWKQTSFSSSLLCSLSKEGINNSWYYLLNWEY